MPILAVPSAEPTPGRRRASDGAAMTLDATLAPARGRGQRVSATPLFAQVREYLRERIASGVLGAGAKLPSEGELEAEFGVSRITVRQALSELHAAGLIDPEVSTLFTPFREIYSYEHNLRPHAVKHE